jgi:hypothetical protein
MVDRNRRNLILDRVWPLKILVRDLELTNEEWICLGADRRLVDDDLLNLDMRLTLLENAASDRTIEQFEKDQS